VTTPRAGFAGPAALVAGELRGYRRFWLAEDGLHPTVHDRGATWRGDLERARCAAGQEHAAPAPACGCGLYGWYHPRDSGRDMGLGDVPAVIAARGRVVLGDHGFRAEAARVEAVALSWLSTATPAARRRARETLARRYPGSTVYGTRRAMLRAHRPDDLSALGITVRPSPEGRYRRTTYAVGLAGLLALHAVFLAVRASGAPPPLAVAAGIVAFVAWQASLVWLAQRSTATSPRDSTATGPRSAHDGLPGPSGDDPGRRPDAAPGG
jgi:hypothetical protein